MSSPWARRAGDVAPYHGCHGACGHGVRAWRTLCMLVGADVPGGPRTRGVPDVVPVGAARRGRRALPWMPWCVCMGAGMACAWCVRTWCAWCMLVGADVPGGPRPRVVPDVVPDVVPVCAARRGRRALPWMPWCVRTWCVHGCVDMVCVVHDGRGRRPRRPAFTWCPRCRPRCRPRVRGAPRTSRPAMGAMVRADMVHGCGHGVRGNGVRAWCVDMVCIVRAWRVHGAWTWCTSCMLVGADVPGGPRTRCRPRCRPRVRGAPGTSRPTMGAFVPLRAPLDGVAAGRV